MLLASIATFSTHDKPWVRTMTRRVIRSILNDPIAAINDGIHPAAGCVGGYAFEQLQNCSGVVFSNVLNELF